MQLARLVMRCALVVLLALASLHLPGTVWAQEGESAGDTQSQSTDAAPSIPAPDYDEWARIAERAEAEISAGETTDQALQDLRRTLVEQRQIFLAAEGENRNRIERVHRQIDSLGPKPAEGETEPDAVAERRAALNSELEQLQAPGLRANEAYIAADGLISEIDGVLRDRQTREILRRAPLPENPLNWVAPISEAGEFFVTGIADMARNFTEPDRLRAASDKLPTAVLLVVLGLILVFRGPRWVDYFLGTLGHLRQGPVVLLLKAVLSFVQLAAPTAGMIVVLVAFEVTGLTGQAGSAVIRALASFAITLIIGLWLLRRLFPRAGEGDSPLWLDESKLARGRLLTWFLVLIYSIQAGLDQWTEEADFAHVTQVYLTFPLILAMAVLLFRIAKLFRSHATRDEGEASAEELDASSFSASVIHAIAGLTMLLTVLAPLAGLLGFMSLAEKTIEPAVLTYFFFGLLSLIQHGFSDFYASISKRDRPLEDSLVPTLFGTVLLLASVPILALLWGALPTDIAEIWSRFRAGFAIGDIRISPNEIIAFIIVFAIGFGVTRLIQGALRTTILPKTKIDHGARTALVSGVGYIGIFLAGLIAITTAGIDLSNLAILASALAVGVGFGLQTIVSNFVSGIILLIERPVSEGDWIEVGGQMGYVRSISVRSTRIETFDRTDVIVPNADLISNQVTNWTRGNLIGRVIVPVGVAYGSDTRKVENILKEIAMAQPMVVLSPPPAIFFMGFGASEMQFEIRAILRDINFMLSVHSDINHEIVRRFAEEGIEIPFPQQDIWLRSPRAAQPDYAEARVPQAGKDDTSLGMPDGDADR